MLESLYIVASSSACLRVLYKSVPALRFQLYKGLLKGRAALILEVIHHWHKCSSDSHWPPSAGSSEMKLSTECFIMADSKPLSPRLNQTFEAWPPV